MTITFPCPLCGGDSQEAFSVGDRNRQLSQERFDYRRCRSCATLFLERVPADLGRYYPPDYYGRPAVADIDAAALAQSPRIDLIRRYAGSGTLVEIGSAFGIFARAAQRAGFDVTAIEMDADACSFLEDALGVRTICSERPEEALPGLGPVDVVALWHVIEHLVHPEALLAAAGRALAPGGILALATPNPASVQFRILGARWAHVDAPRHVTLIPLAALRDAAARHGLELAHVTTTDADGRHWNQFGWEYAFRRSPATRPSSFSTRLAALAAATAMRPLEGHGMNGTAYTAVFVKRAEGVPR